MNMKSTHKKVSVGDVKQKRCGERATCMFFRIGIEMLTKSDGGRGKLRWLNGKLFGTPAPLCS